ncbi:hypothetical protein HZ326_28113, partial [Fusarium oxysporum f. sp. albedinis]
METRTRGRTLADQGDHRPQEPRVLYDNEATEPKTSPPKERELAASTLEGSEGPYTPAAPTNTCSPSRTKSFHRLAGGYRPPIRRGLPDRRRPTVNTAGRKRRRPAPPEDHPGRVYYRTRPTTLSRPHLYSRPQPPEGCPAESQS